MDDEGPIEEHATPSPSPPPEDLRTATEKVIISTADTYANGKLGLGNDAYMTWDCPIQRYRDLGSPRRPVRAVREGKMNGVKKAWSKLTGFGAPTPVNTLDGNNSTRPSLSTSQPEQGITNLPPFKRQRLEETNGKNNDEVEEPYSGPFLEASFALREASPSASASQNEDSQRGKPYSPAITGVQGAHTKRGKHQPKEIIDLASDDGGTEEPIDLVRTRKLSHATVAADELSNRFMSRTGAKRTLDGLGRGGAGQSRMLAKHNMNGKRQRSSSVDELAGDSPSSKFHPSKRTAGHSSDEPQRGHITPIKFGLSANQATRKLPTPSKKMFSPLNRANHIITSMGLKVTRAVSGDYAYPSPAGDLHLPCVLRIHEVSHLLHPTDQQGSLLHQLAFMNVNLRTIKTLKFSDEPEHPIVYIFRAIAVGESSAPKLHIEFGSHNEMQSFKKWAQMARPESFPLKVLEESGDRLEREMVNLLTKAHRGSVIRGADVERSKLPDDLRLVEHNQEQRRQQQQKPTAPRTFTSHDTPRANPRIKDDMHPPMPQQRVEVIDPESPQSPAIRQTRAKRKLRSPSPPPPDLWTEKNPSWADQWRDSLIFPPTGKSRATVDLVDIPRLDQGQFLNDNLIIFYLRYLQHDLEMQRPDLAERIYFHNTFFYEKLKPTKSSAGINYDSVKAWTTKVDLFKKDFIVVPINEFSHWYIAIIYNAPKLDTTACKSPAVNSGVSHTEDLASNSGNVAGKQSTEQVTKSLGNTAGEVTNGIGHMSLNSSGSDPILAANGPSDISSNAKILVGQAGESLSVSGAEPRKPTKKANTGGKKHSPDEPKIITLDSLGVGHSPACRNLKDYLIKELRDKKGADMPDPGSLTMTAKGIPTQSNYCDCGLYLLGYVVQFLRDPDSFIRTLLMHEKIEWNIDAPALRNDIRTLLFKLQNEQIAREDKRVKAKKEAARIRRSRQARSPSGERISEAPASAQTTPVEADSSTIFPVRSDTKRGLVKSPSPATLARESVESPEIASAATTAPKEADVTILDEHKPKTPDRLVASPNKSDRSSSAATELEIETPRAMPSSNGTKGGSPREAIRQPAEDEITESEVERNMLAPLPETPARSLDKEPRALGGNGLPTGESDNPSAIFEVEIPSRARYEELQQEKQKQKAAVPSAHKHPKETPRKSHYFPERERIGGLQKGERVVAATPMPKKKIPEVVNVDDSD
ncbi:cysteine proteinase [Apiospora phragmitis]|uniref:Cysteine proteinase n=1 Tax=Apiospora phragmitis TaxID=2905665 RepID=A0ABR1SUX9_9PEZI